MAPSIPIPEGFELLVGRGRENARKALALADERGFEPTAVRTSTLLNGFLIPLGDSVEDGSDEAIIEEIAFPDPAKANHATIDEFAEKHGVTFEGIEAADAERPTKAEKVTHIEKVIAAQAEVNDQHLAETGELQSSIPDPTDSAAGAAPEGE